MFKIFSRKLIPVFQKWSMNETIKWDYCLCISTAKNYVQMHISFQGSVLFLYTSTYTQPVNPKGNQHWIFLGRTDAEAEAQTLWSPSAKSWLTGKDLNAGKDWGQEKKAMGDEMVGWHHQLNGNESEQTQGDSEGQWSLACCSPWGHTELDMTERLNNSKNAHNTQSL